MVSEKVQPEKMICAFNFVSTLSVSPAHPAVRHSNLAAKYCHMNKSTLKGGKWCPRKCYWKNDLSMHFCIKVWHRHFSIQLLSCHPIKSTSLGGKCSVWEDVTGKEMCAHLLLLFFFYEYDVWRKKQQQQMQAMVYIVIPNTVQIPALYSLLRRPSSRASSRRIAWMFLWKDTYYTQLLWVCLCGVVIIISIFAGSQSRSERVNWQFLCAVLLGRKIRPSTKRKQIAPSCLF